MVEIISRHLDAFAWSASNMLGIDPDFLCYHLTMDPKVRPVRQRRRKFNEERRLVVQEETKMLLSVSHIREIQYPEWLANVVLVKKANRQVESANRILLRGLKRRLEKAKGTWAEEVPRIVWSYHTTPQTSTMETPFSLVYGSDAMIPVEIHESSLPF